MRSEGVIELHAARRKAIAAAPVKVFLLPSVSGSEAQALAARTGCRLMWKGRGIALEPVPHG